MVRRLRPTESRGSKKRSSAVSYNDVNETAADLVAAEVLEAVEIGRTLGEAERDGEFDQTKMAGLMPMADSISRSRRATYSARLMSVTTRPSSPKGSTKPRICSPTPTSSVPSNLA